MDEKTQSNAGLSIFAFSFTMYCSVTLSLSKSRGGSFASVTNGRLEILEMLSGIAKGLNGELHQVLLNTKF